MRLRFAVPVMCRDSFPGKREREPGVSRKYIPVPHPSPRPAGRQDPDCRLAPTHVILTRTMILGLYTGNCCDSIVPCIFLLYSTGSLHSSRTAHFRVSLSTYPDYPAPHVRSGFGLRYWLWPRPCNDPLTGTSTVRAASIGGRVVGILRTSYSCSISTSRAGAGGTEAPPGGT